MKRAPIWISKPAVLAMHERLQAEHGGPTGLRDEGLLDSALASPQNHLAYGRSDILRLAAAYASALVRNHPFVDGNKRIALTVAGVLLELNGVRLVASERDAAQAVRALASREIDEAGFAAWLRACSARQPAERGSPGPRPRASRPDKSKQK